MSFVKFPTLKVPNVPPLLFPIPENSFTEPFSVSMSKTLDQSSSAKISAIAKASPLLPDPESPSKQQGQCS